MSLYSDCEKCGRAVEFGYEKIHNCEYGTKSRREIATLQARIAELEDRKKDDYENGFKDGHSCCAKLLDKAEEENARLIAENAYMRNYIAIYESGAGIARMKRVVDAAREAVAAQKNMKDLSGPVHRIGCALSELDREKTERIIDEAMENLKQGKVSAPVDLELEKKCKHCENELPGAHRCPCPEC